jgi:hypothetical protein
MRYEFIGVPIDAPLRKQYIQLYLILGHVHGDGINLREIISREKWINMDEEDKHDEISNLVDRINNKCNPQQTFTVVDGEWRFVVEADA